MGSSSDRKREAEAVPLGLDAFRREPQDEGLLLDKLNQAFAEMLGTGSDPYTPVPEPEVGAPEAFLEPSRPSTVDEQDSCEITPRSILEAMLFVDNRANQPLSSTRVCELMRGVRPAEVDDLVRELNEQYVANGCPYKIASEGDGYRLVLREEFNRVQAKFYGKARQARLSAGAVEVLALVAYNGPLAADEVSRLRGHPSRAILTQLVRRQLLSVQRPESSPRTPHYRTTQRFLDLFGLASLAELPRSQELDAQ
jgi:segregation and condensation protein B